MMAYWQKVRPILGRWLLPDLSPLALENDRHSWRGQILGWLCLAALVCFTWLPASYFRMVGWPWILIWQLGFLCMGLWLISMLRQFTIPFRSLGYGLDALAGLTALGLVLTAAGSQFRSVAAWNIGLVFGYGLLLYGFHNYIAGDAVKRYLLWFGLAVTGVITSLVSLAYWQPDTQMWQSGDFSAAIRNALPLGHHNFVGGYLVLVLPLVAPFALAQQGWRRWVGLAATGIVLGALYVSGSRGAYLGFLVWAIAAMGVALWTSRGPQRKRLLIGSLLGLIVILAGIGSNPRVRDLVTGIQLQGRGDSAQVTIADSPARDRYFMLQIGKNILRDRPFLGVGPGNLSRVSNLYRPIETGTGLNHIQQLHNTPVQLAAELGLIGIGLYVGWLASIGWLWLRLARKDLATCDRLLLYGVGGSFLAYGVSSLTDYQLENIGIASTLVLNLVLLTGLAAAQLQPPPPIPQRWRRLLSLAVLAGLAIAFRLWLPADVALALGSQGADEARGADFSAADSRWTLAAKLQPWDPTYGALAGQQLLEIQKFVAAEASQEIIAAAILEHFQQAVTAAPNDVWFNQNLALLLKNEPQQAEVYASRAAQLLPRNENFTYYLLGQIYMAQGQRDRAIAALALEGMVSPSFLVMPQWGSPALEALRLPAVNTFLAYSEGLLEKLDPATAGYRQLYEQTALIRWWYSGLADNLNPGLLRPVVQALFLAEAEPQAAIALLDQAIASSSNSQEFGLLKAWIAPDPYLASYLRELNLSASEAAAVRQHIYDYRNVRIWLSSLAEPTLTHNRLQLAMAYRNQNAQAIKTILQPEDLQENALAETLQLFSDYPREFPALDRSIEQIRTEALGLPHPTRNNFQIVAADAA
ncbi:O-antigen ligase family protein [Sphaerothrix gracilis]|uniref:O-antigen ligase family protein n=1 Tax=Sphaerothrix gracilis TaxID=3151835 RepID=UPI0031FCD230